MIDFHQIPSAARIGELKPLPTGVEPSLVAKRTLPAIKAVAFDVYGTLVISGSGDISLARSDAREFALRESLEAFNLKPQSGESLAGHFHAKVREAQEARRKDGIEWPEVEIREVWRNFLEAMTRTGWVKGTWKAEQVSYLAMDYEFRVNPVWPMPGLGEILGALKSGGLPLGIVSNAQFFTPLLFPHFLKKELEDLGFDDGLCVWSFAEREGKPSTRLYQKLGERLGHKKILPASVLYVGNDLRNDIAPARREGFQTALFAGDQRSLRLREDDPLVQGIEPDFVVTELRQILPIVNP